MVGNFRLDYVRLVRLGGVMKDKHGYVILRFVNLGQVTWDYVRLVWVGLYCVSLD